MDFIIEMQGFKNSENIFVPKEVSVLSINKSFFAHWIIMPSCNFCDLPANIRKQNNWQTLHTHGIEWFEGEVPEKHLFANLRELSKMARKLYSYGQEKVTILEQIMAREVINLEDDKSCPSFEDLPSSDAYCILHCMKSSGREFKCALNDATRLKKWLEPLKDNPLNIECFEYEQYRNIGYTTVSPSAYIRCIPSGSNTEGLDETDCSYS